MDLDIAIFNPNIQQKPDAVHIGTVKHKKINLRHRDKHLKSITFLGKSDFSRLSIKAYKADKDESRGGLIDR